MDKKTEKLFEEGLNIEPADDAPFYALLSVKAYLWLWLAKYDDQCPYCKSPDVHLDYSANWYWFLCAGCGEKFTFKLKESPSPSTSS